MKKTNQTVYGPSVKNIDKVLAILEEEYPESTHTSLNFQNPFQLLVATILSAQSTDKLVNRVTPELFKKYRSPEDFANADIDELENDIRSTGFFRNKARNIKACAADIVKKFNSKIPDNIKEFTTLPGVGRKTANVVLANVYGKQAIIVDTHVLRITQRLGLTVNKDATKIEFDMMEIIPQDKWTTFSHQIIAHGRTICDAKKPKCPVCRLLTYCRFGQEKID
jgi:endonuclease-3